MSEKPVVQPQYNEGEIGSGIDCKFCSRSGGMKLVIAWVSLVDPGVMNTRMECISCHQRLWERIPMPQIKIIKEFNGIV